ncbi:preprotein translocase subunit SecE [Intestinibaculum porci]|mgnify:CR=1 FL=1|jgi:preprotein translocase SecE subunit|uniref:Protein translocase subunit SecE n=1 Tax=Intestinibaculum porci TaxID=2487118 RepID=A0A3G9JNG2_9FIRM|nr:preprotein translocase subunit SecE [Intestinibaculum porci]MDD6349402.1 preprotein translocase subunit SecE [Intestinibaculum porci]MDD6422865.1 preprotein translocase subunit SecE [Intestinibaculum porci]BBH25768.1 hypothetical protein SG0102_07020 [Intestinibaculum porci]
MSDNMSKEEKAALKAKLKQERKELRAAKKIERKKRLEDQIDTDPLKFKDWATLSGVREEIKKIHWPTRKELAVDSGVVLAFTIILGAFFYASDAVIALILKALGMN